MINTRITNNKVQILSLANRHGIKSLKIFGSMARDDASETSDADFLVEMEEGYDLFDLLIADVFTCDEKVGGFGNARRPFPSRLKNVRFNRLSRPRKCAGDTETLT